MPALAQAESALVERPGKDTEVPSTLSGHAAEIWRSAFNSAYSGTCKERSDRDACAAKIAWSAVKKKYKKGEGGEWVKKGLLDSSSVYDITNRLEEEFKQKNGKEWWLIDHLITGHLVVNNTSESRHYRVGYEIVSNDQVEFAPRSDWVEVAQYKVWSPVEDEPENMVAMAGKDDDDDDDDEGEGVYRAEDEVAAQVSPGGDGETPAAVDPDRPVIPTPQNLTRAEAELWNRVYLEAFDQECAQVDNPQACAAREAWEAVKAFGEEAEQEMDREVISEDEGEVADEEIGDEESEEEEQTETDEAQSAEEGQAEAEDEDEDEGQTPSLQSVMSKVAEGESLEGEEIKVLSAAIDAAKEGETDEAKVNALDQIMEKVSAGEELSEEEQSILSAALKASDEEDDEEVEKSTASDEVSDAEEGTMPQTKEPYTERQMKALIDAGRALPDGRLPIVTRADLQNVVESFANIEAADTDAIQHIIVRAGSLGALDDLPDHWVNKATAAAVHKVDGDWLDATVERVMETVDDRTWLRNIGEETKIARPDYFSTVEWAELPAVEKTARAHYLRRFVRRMYEQAADDMRVMGWRVEPMELGRDGELQFKRWIEHDEGPLLQRAILVRKAGTTVWSPREISTGASLSSAVRLLPDEMRP